MNRRLIVASGLVGAARFASGRSVVAQGATDDLEQPSRPGGIGNTRSDIDGVYGPAERQDDEPMTIGETTTDSTSYEDEWVFFELLGNERGADDRAFIIHRYSDPFAPWTYDEAIAVANELLPLDVVATSDLLPFSMPNGAVIEYRQQFYSESIARLIPNPDLYREGAPGDVWLILSIDFGQAEPGYYSTVNVRLESP